MSESTGVKQKIENFIAANRIVDLEWRFSSNLCYGYWLTFLVSPANSVIDNKSDCLLYLKITSEDPQNKREVLNLELTIAQFFEIQNELQKMKSMVEFVS